MTIDYTILQICKITQFASLQELHSDVWIRLPKHTSYMQNINNQAIDNAS